MIVSHKYRYVFVHIPKTAGVSIMNCLSNSIGKNDNITYFRSGKAQKLAYKITRKDDIRFNMHSSIREPLSKLNISKYFKFAFVRNPWDRMVSLYFYLQSTAYGEIDTNMPSFSEWIMSDIDKIKTFIPLSKQLIFKKKPQLAWLADNNKIHMDFIGRFENLQGDFDKITELLGLPTTKLMHENRTTHDYYAEYYNRDTIDKVSKWYKEDIEYFGYKFEK